MCVSSPIPAKRMLGKPPCRPFGLNGLHVFGPFFSIAILLTVTVSSALAPSSALAQGGSRATPAFRPIGAPSAVDRYHGQGVPVATSAPITSPAPTYPTRTSEDRFATRGEIRMASGERPVVTSGGVTLGGEALGGGGEVRQTVWMQSDPRNLSAPQLPGGGFDFPSGVGPGVSAEGVRTDGGVTAAPGQGMAPDARSPGGGAGSVPRTLPPAGFGSGSSGDYAPIPAPQLGQVRYATVDDCALVSRPSGYVARTGFPCGTPVATSSPFTYSVPPAQIAAPVALPPSGSVIGGIGTGRPGPLPPLFTLGQERNPVQVGQGLWGQPVAYVPGQGVRNFIRYWFP